jgi:hypothetical protein
MLKAYNLSFFFAKREQHDAATMKDALQLGGNAAAGRENGEMHPP